MFEKIKFYIITIIISFVLGFFANCAYTSGKAKRMESRVDSLKLELESVSSEREDLRGEREQLETTISGLVNQIEQFNSGLSELNTIGADLETGLNDLQGKIRTNRIEIQRAKQRTIRIDQELQGYIEGGQVKE